jgi:hypothetical protein
MDYFNKINTKPRLIYSFSNYFNTQPELLLLKTQVATGDVISSVICGRSGSGVTHVLNAICNKLTTQSRKVMYMTTQWLAYLHKNLTTDKERDNFIEGILAFDVIALDNIQFLFKKNSKQSQIFIDIVNLGIERGRLLLLGCSDLNKDITKSKRSSFMTKLNRFNIKELGSYDIYCALTSLISREDQIPGSLIYAISAYNGTIQQHINCLISLRFNRKDESEFCIDNKSHDFDELFNLKKYFPRQQFRKNFMQPQLTFGNETECMQPRMITI